MELVSFQTLNGKTFSGIEVDHDGEYIYFHCADGTIYKMYHIQKCCEYVYIESIVGDINDLLESPILLADESSSYDIETSESATWTFYKLATKNGYVDIRWYGGSNGNYSESVGLYRVE